MLKDQDQSKNVASGYHNQLLKTLKLNSFLVSIIQTVQYIVLLFPTSVVGWKTTKPRKPHTCESDSKTTESTTCLKFVKQNILPAASLLQVFNL